MPNNESVFEIPRILATLVAIVAFFGAFASTSGTTHTNVANQLRTLIVEFHKWNLSKEDERHKAVHHLQVLQAQIEHFANRVNKCRLIHMFSYGALTLTSLFIPVAILGWSSQIVSLVLSILVFLVVMTCMRIQELRLGHSTIQIAVDEVLDVHLDLPFKS